MSLSDRFRSFVNKKSDSPKEEPEVAAHSAPPPTPLPAPLPTPAPVPEPPSRTLEEVGQLIAQERSLGEAKQKTMNKELRDLRASLDKMEISTKASRESQNQSLQFLQQDAEREIKYFERKLQEDIGRWDKQLKDREKAIEQALRQGEAGQQEKKSAFEQSYEEGMGGAQRAEALLKEQEAKLLEERQRWRDLLQTKETELLTLKQDLARRETDLEQELKLQEGQRKSAQELWQTRLKELERQWADKRKSWEEAMRSKEEERLRLHSTFQEKQAAWQLEQERRLQDVMRRQERAQEKLSALKAHLVKETQTWQQLSQNREEQLQQLKVKLLLSESEAKGQMDEAQKAYQDSISHTTSQIQTLQRQIQEEQDVWQKQIDIKDRDIAVLKGDVHQKLRQMEADFTQRMAVLQSDKETLNAELVNIQTEYRDAQTLFLKQTETFKTEHAALENDHAQRAQKIKAGADAENAALQAQLSILEKQKEEASRDMDTLRLRWQQDLAAKDQVLKETQNAIAPQEMELRKRYADEEESLTRQTDALKSRLRAIERDLVRTKENIEKTEREQLAVAHALESDYRAKEEALRERSEELLTRLQKRLEERRVAVDAFMMMKKEEESRVQTALQTKEKERIELTTRLQTLPQELAKALEDAKAAAEKESGRIRERIGSLETELAQARDNSKTVIQGKATEMAALRQELELKHKDITSVLRSREQILESERAQMEKQMAAAQSEMDRVRTHFQEEIDKKEKDIEALQGELRKQEALQRQTLQSEQTTFAAQLTPLEKQRESLGAELEQLRITHEQTLTSLEQEKSECLSQLQQVVEKERQDKTALETKIREQQAHWKASLAALTSERAANELSGRQTLDGKGQLIEQLEDQLRAQAVAHESRRRELIHQATLKSRTLQEIIQHIELELKTSQELLPQQLREREESIVQLRAELAAATEKHARTLARYERALSTLDRRGRQREEALRIALRSAQEEGAKKLADRDAEIAALQSNLLAKESERQGELDRLAKQFAEERFQLEKSKDDLEWKLKDRKEVSERQLAARQKEIQSIENDILRAKTQRDEEIAQKSSIFETEKTKLQQTLLSLEKQLEDTRQTQDTALAGKEQELQTLLMRSKEHLRVLGDEFNQKVGLWRATNDTLRGQIEQLKGHVAQAQDHWEVIRKEKSSEVSGLRQELAEWETRIKNDAEEFERVFSAERQNLTTEVRQHEQLLRETIQEYEARLKAQEDAMVQSSDSVREQEQNAEAQWHAALEQWETDKQGLQRQKATLEQDLVQMQNRFQADLRQSDEVIAKLKMDVAFKETHAASQKERMQSQMQRDLDPLRDRLARLMSDEESERAAWETRLHAKEDELKMLKARVGLREKRLQEETRRRFGEIEKLRKQVVEEVAMATDHYNAERTQLEKKLLEKREALAQWQVRENDVRRIEKEDTAALVQGIQAERAQLEESLRQVLTQREKLRENFESLLRQRDEEADVLAKTLETRDQEMETLRQNAKEQAELLRKKMDGLRQSNKRNTLKQGPTSAAVWNAFEAGVASYQIQHWEEAAHAFEDCLKKDAQWGAAYQYLALTYQAQGRLSEAADIAARAKELDPGNTQLATWADRLQAQIKNTKAG